MVLDKLKLNSDTYIDSGKIKELFREEVKLK